MPRGRLLAGLTSTAAASVWAVHRARRRQIEWTPPSGHIHRGPLTTRCVGETGPPIVLLHGLAASGRIWGAAFDTLGNSHRLIVPDLLGFADSPLSTGGYGPDDHANAVVACLTELGADDEPIVIAGHSMGALIAIHIAAQHPRLVRAVIALAPPLYRDATEARHRIGGLGGLGGMARLMTLDTSTAHLACQWSCDHRAVASRIAQLVRPDLPPAIARDGVRHTWQSYSQSLQQVILTAPTRPLIAQLGIPVELIAGTRDRIAPPDILVGLDDTPTVTLTSWDTRHDLHLERPHDCVTAIEEACYRLPGNVASPH